MNPKVVAIFLVFLASVASAYAQATVTVYDPTSAKPQGYVSPAIETAVDEAVAAASKSISEEICKPETDIVGTATGAFTRAKSKQTLAFYQYCRTGNGFGWAGLVLIEGDKVVGNFISNAGWTVGVGRVADLNGNGLDEFVLAYSGGMHQGQGGVGVDLMEFVNGAPSGIGWYKAEEYGVSDESTVWKLTAKPGPTPAFYTQKYSGDEGRYKSVGKPVAANLDRPYSKFTAVK